MTFFNRITTSFIGAIALFYAANIAFADDDTPTLNANVGYISIQHLPVGGDRVNPIRFAAIRQAATSLGARGGLAWEGRNIDAALQTESIFLDQVFNFNLLLLGHNVLPPVLDQSNNNLNLDNNDTLRIATKAYKILRPARFVTAPPNWRDYMWMRFQRPTLPDRSLLPETKAEEQVWNHYILKGWHSGCEQALAIFTDNLNRMKRDMLGMILYRKLLALHMVSAPFVASADLGVTGDASQLRINDQILRITGQSQLQPNPTKWKPVITK
ncbi:MAG: type IV secretion system protein DotC [Gammaproteobacteria bacterium RIFCSPHIGHO2_12_FULL_38_11]|nr:MAG: type IV secretion system protein DotC [Gammaproteobacteria bacterium RIFCSPHIGHO2_12_FULL_38_11]